MIMTKKLNSKYIMIILAIIGFVSLGVWVVTHIFPLLLVAFFSIGFIPAVAFCTLVEGKKK